MHACCACIGHEMPPSPLIGCTTIILSTQPVDKYVDKLWVGRKNTVKSSLAA